MEEHALIFLKKTFIDLFARAGSLLLCASFLELERVGASHHLQ